MYVCVCVFQLSIYTYVFSFPHEEKYIKNVYILVMYSIDIL